MEFLGGQKIYLASKSPRRHEILRLAGIPFEVLDSEFEETVPSEMPVFDIARHLAEMKAAAAIDKLPEGGVLLTADSVVILKEKVFGKPRDRKEAYSMLAHLSGKIHQVITGVCLCNRDKSVSFDSTTEVFFRPLENAEINYYIDNYMPYDKAGAYGIQDWMGMTKISRIEGSFYNVMGLPVDLVFEALRGFQSKEKRVV